jgi:hypothetical protein
VKDFFACALYFRMEIQCSFVEIRTIPGLSRESPLRARILRAMEGLQVVYTGR